MHIDTFERERGNEMFPPGTSKEYQRHWWQARLEILGRELAHADRELAKLIERD